MISRSQRRPAVVETCAIDPPTSTQLLIFQHDNRITTSSWTRRAEIRGTSPFRAGRTCLATWRDTSDERCSAVHSYGDGPQLVLFCFGACLKGVRVALLIKYWCQLGSKCGIDSSCQRLAIPPRCCAQSGFRSEVFTRGATCAAWLVRRIPTVQEILCRPP